MRRLDAVLNLTDKNGLHVMLDNHGDMVGSLGCGNGVPAWFQKKAPGVEALIGKPLETHLPYSLVSSLNVKNVGGYDHCGQNETMWAQHAGDPEPHLPPAWPCAAQWAVAAAVVAVIVRELQQHGVMALDGKPCYPAARPALDRTTRR